jgi:hypothetical protein
VKHVRTLGNCLGSISMMVAVLAVAATSASAAETKELFEHFNHCPVNSTQKDEAGYGVNLCFLAISNGKSLKTGGQFSVGGVTVPLNQVIYVQGGEILNEETGVEEIVGPEDGAPTFYSPPLHVPGGLGRVKPFIASWPTALKDKWNKALLAKPECFVKPCPNEAKEAKETPELVGKPGISRTNLLFEEGTALEVPLRIHLTNPFGSLLGEHCYAGGAEEPIVQRLTSGSTEYDKPASPPEGWTPIHGKVGELAFFDEFQLVRITKNLVVDNTYAVPAAHGCQTPGFPESEGLVDEAIDKAFGLPAAGGASVTEVKGTLWNATAEEVKRVLGE